MINLKVSELMGYIKGLTSKDYVLTRLIVEGEISNFKFHNSGTAYFSIKDEFAKIDCIFYNFNQKKDIKEFKNGDLVGITGKVSLNDKDGYLNILVEDIEKIGLGKLYENFLLLKEELEKEGYFDEKHKIELPQFPKKVGIITSPTGAAIKDILSVTERRNSFVSLYIYPANVQGANAVESLIKGLEFFENSDVDVVIIGRGGGSYEDLDCFNSKELALRIFNFTKPIVSAVGHEVDFVITDFVADRRAATPSVAAEIVVPDFNAYLETVNSRLDRIRVLANRNVENEIDKLEMLKKRINLLSIENTIDNKLSRYRDRISYLSKDMINKVDLELEKLNSISGKVDYQILIDKFEKILEQNSVLINNIEQKLQLRLNTEENSLVRYKSRIDKLDIKTMLQQGYSIVTNLDGRLIKSIEEVETDETLEIVLGRGELIVKVLERKG